MPKVFSVPVERIDIEEINNGDFLKLKLYAISDTVNRNNSEFLRAVSYTHLTLPTTSRV